MLERKDVEVPTIAYAQEQGFEHRKLKWIGRRGAPDDIFLDARDGAVFPFLIEFKAPGKKTPRADQRHQVREIQRLRKARIHVYVCDNVEDGRRIIDAERRAAAQLSAAWR